MHSSKTGGHKMANYKNQYKFTIAPLGSLEHKEEKSQFLVALNWTELLDVVKVLSPSEYIVWLYILKWRGKNKKTGETGIYYFAPAEIEIETGLSESTIHRAKGMLEKLGFLVKTGVRTYDFIPYPSHIKSLAQQKVAEIILKHKQKDFGIQNDYIEE